MLYDIKSYGDDKFLLIKDPYTKKNLEAVKLYDKEDFELLSYNILSFYNYYDFRKTIRYDLFLNEFPTKKDVTPEDVKYCVDSISEALEIPKSQASQLVHISTYKKEVKLKSTYDFREAYINYHNLTVFAINCKLYIQ